MNKSITESKKKSCLLSFIKENTVQQKEAKWILNVLASNETYLSNLHVVEQAHKTPRGLIISAKNVSGRSLILFVKGKPITNPQRILENIRSEVEEPLYLQLNLHPEASRGHYVLALEDNPYHTDITLSKDDQHMVETLLEKSLHDFEYTHITCAIDQALDEKNKDAFFTLTAKLHVLENK